MVPASFVLVVFFFFFFFNDTATTEIYTLSLHDALPIFPTLGGRRVLIGYPGWLWRSEEHTSELQSRSDLVGRLLLEKKKKNKKKKTKEKKKTKTKKKKKKKHTT